MLERLIQRLFGGAKPGAEEPESDEGKKTDKAPVPQDGLKAFHTQYPGGEARPPRLVVIGLDFGTAFTKVAIADPNDSHAIMLRPSLNGLGAFLQPGLLGENDEGYLEIPDSSSAKGLDQNLKLKLIESPQDISAATNASAFLALVLQKARLRFMEKQKGVFGNSRLDWHFNIGLPAENYDNQPLTDAVRAVAETAWTLSVLEGPLSQSKVKAVFNAVTMSGGLQDASFDEARGRLIHPGKIGVVPEVLAETVSYARSPSRNDGLHLLVDVGAGTLDVNMFGLLVNDQEDRYVAFCTRVFPNLGFVHLARHRFNAFEQQGIIEEENSARFIGDPCDLPDRTQLVQQLPVTRDDIDYIDGAFLSEIGGSVYEVINRVYQDHRNAVHRWHDELLITFLAGGGSEDPAYGERLRYLSRGLREIGRAGIDLKTLPKPERFQMQGVSEGLFHRLSVAYGLAQDIANLGDYIPPAAVPQTPPMSPPDNRGRFIGPEHT